MQLYYVNLTPHDVDYYHDNGKITTYPRSGSVARVDFYEELVEVINDNEKVHQLVNTNINDLPPSQEGVVFIVSAIVQVACKDLGIERNDLISPYDLVLGRGNNVQGCRAWRRY